MSAYAEASKAVFEVFEQTTPLVEGTLDRRGVPRCRRAATDLGLTRRHRRAATARRARAGRPAHHGRVARTKFLAKVASGVAKPDGLLVVPPDGRVGLPPPPAGGAALGRRATSPRQAPPPRNHELSAHVAEVPEAALVSMLGPAAGRHLHALAHNRDPRPVQVGRRRRSIGAQRALGRMPKIARRSRRRPRRPCRPPRPAGCGLPTESAAPSCSGCASTTSASHPVAHPSRGDRADPDRSSALPGSDAWRWPCR